MLTKTPRSISEAAVPEKWALVELVGYQIFAGKVSDQCVDGKQYIRVDVPETEVHKAFDCKFGIESVHRITPITQEQAEAVIKQRERGRFALNFFQVMAFNAEGI